MVMVEPKLYHKFVTYDRKGVAILYVKMNKTLYVLLKSDLLFYKYLVEDIGAYGFKIKPRDPYVSNNIINGKKMTVTRRVDDFKISHQYAFEITKFTTYLSGIYGKKINSIQRKNTLLSRYGLMIF